jgi:hypothetical protein
MSVWENLGSPDLKLAGLSIWVLSSTAEDSCNDWDGNWLTVVAHCAAPGAQVRVSGEILHRSELARWYDQARQLHRELTGIAELVCTEPNLGAKIELSDGRGTLRVEITPDHLAQEHRFQFEIDQSYLAELTTGLARVLQKLSRNSEPS